jgi:hypothetical protein
MNRKRDNKDGTTKESSQQDNDDDDNDTIQIGPDLNATRSLLDRKLYRQIILPNGLRCVLIQDTVSMQHQEPYNSDDDDDDDNDDDPDEDDKDDEDTKDMNETKKDTTIRPRLRQRPSRRLHSEDDDDDEKDEGMSDDDEDEDDDDGDEEDDNNNIRDAAVAMIVGVGSCYDPMEWQGLAH